MSSCTAVFERNEDGWWYIHIAEVPGCHTQARTVESGRRRIREALGLFVENAQTVIIHEDVHLPEGVKRLIERCRDEAEHVAAVEEQLRGTRAEAIAAITRELSLSTRDAGELLGISHQRIHQLAHTMGQPR